MKTRRIIGLALTSATLALPASAHKPSDSYLSLAADGSALSGWWDIALRDLDRALVLDHDGDGALTSGELSAREAELSQYALSHLQLARGGEVCSVHASSLRLVEHSDGPYARLPLDVRCRAESAPLELQYGLFFALDPQHRAIVETGGEAQVITAQRRTLRVDLTRPEHAASSLGLVRQGMEHILSGLDHVLFLLALLLPSVLRRKQDESSSVRQIRSVLGDVVRVVTAFTVAHSLTLGLAALGLVSMSADVIEPAIAASVAIAALDNLWPVFGADRWTIAFALGLLHGFGFSSALSDLGLSGAALLRGLCAFNVGVELGQLGVVLVFVPLAFVLRRAHLYRFVLLRGGSLAIAALSLVWFYERVVGG
jgi:hypothetical protein